MLNYITQYKAQLKEETTVVVTEIVQDIELDFFCEDLEGTVKVEKSQADKYYQGAKYRASNNRKSFLTSII
jgi:hypothetical protein